jgi:predicted dehydrogenase
MDVEDHIRVFSYKGAEALLERPLVRQMAGAEAPGSDTAGTLPGLPSMYGSAELYLQSPSGAGGLPPRGFAGAIDALLRALVEGREAPVPGEEGRRSLVLVLAAYQSIESGRLVTLPL